MITEFGSEDTLTRLSDEKTKEGESVAEQSPKKFERKNFAAELDFIPQANEYSLMFDQDKKVELKDGK